MHCPPSSPHRGPWTHFLWPGEVYCLQCWWCTTGSLSIQDFLSSWNHYPNCPKRWDRLVRWPVQLSAIDWVRTSELSLLSGDELSHCSEHPKKHSQPKYIHVSSLPQTLSVHAHTLCTHISKSFLWQGLRNNATSFWRTRFLQVVSFCKENIYATHTPRLCIPTSSICTQILSEFSVCLRLQCKQCNSVAAFNLFPWRPPLLWKSLRVVNVT